MDKYILKTWLLNNLVNCNNNINHKKANVDWFSNYNYKEYWDSVLEHTDFLDKYNPTFIQRLWHLINDNPIIKCLNPNCNNIPKFISYTVGYRNTCSYTCLNHSPEMIEKRKATNIKKYGAEYGFQNEAVKNKIKETMIEKYNVDNISKSSEHNLKKQETCLKNYGRNWYLGRQDLKEQHVVDKYGVKNVQQVPEIVQKRIDTRTDIFFDSLTSSDRFRGKVVPAFTKEEYIGTCKFYNFKCTACGEVFNYQLRHERIPRCPVCYPLNETSQFEQAILEYIKSLLPESANIIENDRAVLDGGLELDILIPEKNLAIECDGLYWHGEHIGEKGRKYHINKTTQCEAKGIRLIHIFEDEWRDKEGSVKSKLKHLLKLNISNRVYARKCEIIDVSKPSKSKFLDMNHIQGDDNSSIEYGLQFGGKLLAVMTFCRRRVFMNHKNTVDGEYELSRYATEDGYNIIGGAAKLLSHFIKEKKPKNIISYADRRWTYFENNLYEQLGFKKVSSGTPNYWYFNKGIQYKRHHRFGFAKHVLPKKLEVFDINKTEWENMVINGWDRIWDCGSLKYELILDGEKDSENISLTISETDIQ